MAQAEGNGSDNDRRFDAAVLQCEYRAGQRIAAAVHLDDASVGLEALRAVRFLLGQQERLLVRGLIDQRYELDLGVRDLDGFLQIAHLCLTSFSA